MKKTAILTVIILSSLLVSCYSVNLDPEFDNMEKHIQGFSNIYQINKFDQTFICNNWVLNKVSFETYEDGRLVNSEDLSEHWQKNELSFWSDHTQRNGNTRIGTWKYSHNFLMWGAHGSYYCQEVMLALPGILVLRKEEFPSGIRIDESSSYYSNKSGEHCFMVYEYIAE